MEPILQYRVHEILSAPEPSRLRDLGFSVAQKLPDMPLRTSSIPKLLESRMDEVYRKYRIALFATDRWRAKITHVRGASVPLKATSTLEEGEFVCLQRAQSMVDDYLDFLGNDTPDSDVD